MKNQRTEFEPDAIFLANGILDSLLFLKEYLQEKGYTDDTIHKNLHNMLEYLLQLRSELSSYDLH